MTCLVDQSLADFLSERLDGVDKVNLDQSHASRHALLVSQQVDFCVFEVTLYGKRHNLG